MKPFCFSILVLAATAFGISPSLAQNPRPKDDPAYLKKAAFQVDQYVAAFYRRQKLDVPGVTDDATFLRRAFLVSIGRIPSSEEAISFLEINDPKKREELIAYLLNSPGHASHMSNWAFDLLRLTDKRVDSLANNSAYRNWVRNAIEDNMPWNVLVNNLLASSGDGWDPANGGVGYYTRDRGMPLDNLANTMRVFLGTRMECAQCHDDPFGKTERHDFYQLAAFTHGQTPIGEKLIDPLYSEIQKQPTLDSDEYRLVQLLRDGVYSSSLGGGGTGSIPLPEDYQYRDAKPGEVVGAKTPFGKPVRMSEKKEGHDGRKELADWIINRTGDQFPTVIANRMWRQVMGKGLYEPVDEYLTPDKTAYPEMVTFLAKLMVDLDYDIRAFQHVLMLTRTFQFGTNPDESVVVSGDDFHGRKITRLSSEQIWDSLITLANGNPDENIRRPFDDRIFLNGKPVLPGRKMGDLSKEVLAIKTEPELRTYFNKLLKELQTGGEKGAGGESMSMTSMSMSSKGGYNKDSKVRASELPSPAPRDHFLYTFGQSDRMVVEGASRDPNIGQVLSLMNGFVQRQLVNNPKAHIYQTLEGASSPEEKVRRLYISILSRPPTDEEMKWMLEEAKTKGDAGLRNITSVLVMSSEFLFLQ